MINPNKHIGNKMNKLLKWIRVWGTLIMVSIMFIQNERIELSLYITDFLPSRVERFDINYSYPDRATGYAVDGNDRFDIKILKEYMNRDSTFRLKFNSRRIHNYILTKFKHNSEHGKANVLHCTADVVGYRLFLPGTYPNILKIRCD